MNEKGPTQDKELTFEEAFEKLSQIVETLESGEGTLTEMAELFEEGMELSKICTMHLDAIEQKVEILLGDGEETVPFEEDED